MYTPHTHSHTHTHTHNTGSGFKCMKRNRRGNMYCVFALHLRHFTTPSKDRRGKKQERYSRLYVRVCSAYAHDNGTFTAPAGLSDNAHTCTAFGENWHPGLHFALEEFVLNTGIGIPDLLEKAPLRASLLSLAEQIGAWVAQAIDQGFAEERIHFSFIENVLRKLRSTTCVLLEFDTTSAVACTACSHLCFDRRYICQEDTCDAILCRICEGQHQPAHKLTLEKLCQGLPIVDATLVWCVGFVSGFLLWLASPYLVCCV